MSFVHLHNHSDYSLLDGALKIEDLVDRIKALGMPAVALTDHGNMFAAIRFYRYAQDNGIKPILGLESYLSANDELVFSGGKPALYHLILLVKERAGYANLMRLSTKSYLEGFYYKPRITRKWLKEHREGLICLSGCAHGEISSYLSEDNPDGAREAALFYRDLFGEDFYLEVQDHGIEAEKKTKPLIMELGESLKIKVIATNDCHYLLPEHFKSHEILLCIGTGTTLEDEKRFRYSTDQLYVKSEAEMREVFSSNPEVLENTLEIADRCNLPIDFGQTHLPRFPIPQASNAATVYQYLRDCALEGAEKRYGKVIPQEARGRLEYELKIIGDMGFSGYFLIVKDFTDFARGHNIAVGPGRGSATGSLVSYCLGITNLDPLKYGLLFERFLNPERVTMPDIDIDFADNRRDEVIKYVKEKYGTANVTQIITFGKMLARGVVRDVGRVMGFSYGDIDKLAKKIPPFLGMTLHRALEESQELRAEIDSNPAYQEMIKHCLILEGLNRNPSTHAAGVVIAPDELTKYTPLFKTPEGEITSQYDMNVLEAIGLLKMDFLGLKTLTVIENTIQALNEKGTKLDIYSIPLDDEETLRIFQEGRTVGLFQFESSGMQEYLRKLKPERLEDLIAMNALYRPGPMQFIDDFISRKHGTEQIKYLHPSLESILAETYGVIVYQEQVIKIAHEFAGFKMGKADILRRAMGKKKPEMMEAMKREFIEAVVSRGHSQELGEEIYNLIEKFAEYGFNKSHSAGYALIAYQTGYLKAHHPVEFMAASMTSEIGDSDRIQKLANECKNLGIEILPPDVNESGIDFSVTTKGIRFGLIAVKNVGEGAVKAILEARRRVGIFNNIFNFITEVDPHQINRKALESLIQAGAFDSLERNRSKLFANIDRIMLYGNAVQEERVRGQFSFFESGGEGKVFSPPEMEPVSEWPRFERLSREKGVLGYFVSGHPLEKYRLEVENFSSPAIENLENMPDNAKVRLCGIITKVSKKLTKKGDLMALATIEDFTGSTEVLFFQKTFEQFKTLLIEDTMIALDGRTSTKEDEPVKVVVENAVPLERARTEFTRALQITLDTSQMTSDKMKKLETILKAYPGKTTLILMVCSGKSVCRLKSGRFTLEINDNLLKDLSDLAGKNNIRLLF